MARNLAIAWLTAINIFAFQASFIYAAVAKMQGRKFR